MSNDSPAAPEATSARALPASETPPQGGLRVRIATVTDAEALLEIYNREVLESLVTLDLVPRTLHEQQTYLGSRRGALAVIVAELAEGDHHKIVGFASLSAFRDRPGYRTSVENSIYVHRDHHRIGIGTLLLAELITQARAHGFHALFARIANSQPASVALHEAHGFFLVGTEREVGRKFSQWLDVAVMQLLL